MTASAPSPYPGPYRGSAPSELRVGGYRLIAKIGEGGMGVVHLAQGADGHRVALKVLRPHVIGDDEARERLAREVSSMQRVRSPRIAEIIDADPWGDTPYVATRYIPGLSLHQHVREHGAVTGTDLTWFAAGLAEALTAVHQVGVLHRDIKPSNVLLEGRSPVLIDFGLARVAEDPRLTHTGWLLGTPGYLAPEVLYGEDATTASDVHAWAATVAFAALGRPPFGTGPAMAILDRVRRGEHDLSGMPEHLRPLLEQALAADPADRPSTGVLLATLRSRLEAPAAPRPDRDDFTMPYAAVLPDDDETETGRLDTGAAGGVAADADPTARQPAVAPPLPAGPPDAGAQPAAGAPATLPLTVPGPRLAPPADGAADQQSGRSAQPQPVQQEPARAPYMQPPPPRWPDRQAQARPPLLAPTGREQRSGSARGQRLLLVAGLGAAVTAGFAVAPYLCALLLAVVVLAVRTFSWTTESARQRQHLRGRRRWYDGGLTLASTPWYLLVATGGTLMLLTWTAFLTFFTVLVLALTSLPTSTVLLLGGGVLAFTTWWGPGAKRLRLPTYRLVGAVTRDRWIGWTVVAAVLIVVAALLWTTTAGAPIWDPQPGPPWREGTLLGGLRGAVL